MRVDRVMVFIHCIFIYLLSLMCTVSGEAKSTDRRRSYRDVYHVHAKYPLSLYVE